MLRYDYKNLIQNRIKIINHTKGLFHKQDGELDKMAADDRRQKNKGLFESV